MAAIEVLLKVTQNETAYPVPPAPLCPGLRAPGCWRTQPPPADGFLVHKASALPGFAFLPLEIAQLRT